MYCAQNSGSTAHAQYHDVAIVRTRPLIARELHTRVLGAPQLRKICRACKALEQMKGFCFPTVSVNPLDDLG
jgi:hypothetical protein